MSTPIVGSSSDKPNIPKKAPEGIQKLPVPVLRLILSSLDGLSEESASQVNKLWTSDAVVAAKQYKASEINGVIKFILNMIDAEQEKEVANSLEELLKNNPIIGSRNLLEVKQNQLAERVILSRQLSRLPISELDKLEQAFSTTGNEEGRNIIILARTYKNLAGLNNLSKDEQNKVRGDAFTVFLELGHLNDAEQMACELYIESNLYAYLAELAEKYAALGNKVKAVQMANFVGNYGQRVDITHFIIKGLTKRGDIESALELINGFDESSGMVSKASIIALKQEGFGMMVEALLTNEDFPGAIRVANLADDYHKSFFLKTIAIKVAERDKVRAREIANTIPNEARRLLAFRKIDEV